MNYSESIRMFTQIIKHGIHVDIPHFVVIGTQNSGKSTVCNRLFDLTLTPMRRTVSEKLTAKTRTKVLLEIMQSDVQDTYVSLNINGVESEKISDVKSTDDMHEVVNGYNNQLQNNNSFDFGSHIHLKCRIPNVLTNLIGWDYPGINYTDLHRALVDNIMDHSVKYPSAVYILVVDGDPILSEGFQLLSRMKIDNDKIIVCFTKADLEDKKEIYKFLIKKYITEGYHICALKNPNINENSIIDYVQFEKDEFAFFAGCEQYREVLQYCGIDKLKNLLATKLQNRFVELAPKILTNLKQEKDKLQQEYISYPDNCTNDVDKCKMICNIEQDVKREIRNILCINARSIDEYKQTITNYIRNKYNYLDNLGINAIINECTQVSIDKINFIVEIIDELKKLVSKGTYCHKNEIVGAIISEQKILLSRKYCYLVVQSFDLLRHIANINISQKLLERKQKISSDIGVISECSKMLAMN